MVRYRVSNQSARTGLLTASLLSSVNVTLRLEKINYAEASLDTESFAQASRNNGHSTETRYQLVDANAIWL